MEVLEQVQRGDIKLIRGLGYLSCEDRLKKVAWRPHGNLPVSEGGLQGKAERDSSSGVVVIEQGVIGTN